MNKITSDPNMTNTQKTSEFFKSTGRSMWRSGSGFAKVGALYSGVECCIEGVSPTCRLYFYGTCVPPIVLAPYQLLLFHGGRPQTCLPLGASGCQRRQSDFHIPTVPFCLTDRDHAQCSSGPRTTLQTPWPRGSYLVPSLREIQVRVLRQEADWLLLRSRPLLICL